MPHALAAVVPVALWRWPLADIFFDARKTHMQTMH